MKNIYNYVLEYQNEEIKEINTIDAMVFARLSYLHLEEVQDKLPVKIKDLNSVIEHLKTNSYDKKLVELVSNAKRFKELEIERCHYILDKERECQFFAITIILPNNEAFISFRGTNRNIIGYKEDLNMSYMTIPAQEEAVNYLNSELSFKKYYLGGHSKGGNMAMYAGIYAKYMRRSKIKKIFNFDGPGFLELDDKFYLMRKKIINYFPECSIVGRLMQNDNYINAIKVSKSGIEAHNLYNWKVIRDDLEYGLLSCNSDAFHESCLKLLSVIDKEKRKIIIDYLFLLVLKGEIKSIKELTMEDVKKIVNNVPKIEKKDKEELLNFMKSFMKMLLPL